MSKKTRIVFSTYCTVKFAALNVLAPEIAGNYIAPETDCKTKRSLASKKPAFATEGAGGTQPSTHVEWAGGELRFRMGNKPNKDWGSAPADRPPSGLLKATS
jgi:hypothetical protein